ncbi:hypothetical protein ACFE04_013313 [Oxalis oulophora]
MPIGQSQCHSVATPIASVIANTASVTNVVAIYAFSCGGLKFDFVEKIFGLNTEAMVSIDMPAGPSEVLVIAYKHARPVHAVNFSNVYAPVHLIINVKDAEKWESFIENARPWTAEIVGGYAGGTNHIIPTYGYARMYSGVSLDSFPEIHHCAII